jgi:hypothetical protein
MSLHAFNLNCKFLGVPHIVLIEKRYPVAPGQRNSSITGRRLSLVLLTIVG